LNRFILTLLSLITLFTVALHPKEKPSIQTYGQLESSFKQAYLLEKSQLYPQARKQYLKLLDITLKQFEAIPNDEKNFYFPVLVSSAVRSSLITAKVGYGMVNPLYMQLDQLKENEEAIDKVLALTIDFLQNQPQKLSRRHVSELYIARAYLRIATTSKMMDGIYWKKSIIYPFPGITTLLNFAMTDIGYALQDHLVLEMDQLSAKQMNDQILMGFKEELENKVSYKTLAFCYDQSDPLLLANFLAKRDKTLYDFQKYFRSSDCQKSLESAKLLLSPEDFLNHVSIYSTFQEFNRILGIR